MALTDPSVLLQTGSVTVVIMPKPCKHTNVHTHTPYTQAHTHTPHTHTHKLFRGTTTKITLDASKETDNRAISSISKPTSFVINGYKIQTLTVMVVSDVQSNITLKINAAYINTSIIIYTIYFKTRDILKQHTFSRLMISQLLQSGNQHQ